jgi:hypothetical protein
MARSVCLIAMVAKGSWRIESQFHVFAGRTRLFLGPQLEYHGQDYATIPLE